MPFTAFKYVKAEGWKKKAIDYIFMARNNYFTKNRVVVTGFMGAPELRRDDLMDRDTGYPTGDHPSDHFSIGYKVTLK